MKSQHSHAKSSVQQMSAFSIFTQQVHRKPIKLLRVSDIDKKYKKHMMSPINRKYQIKFTLPEILKRDLSEPLSSRRIFNHEQSINTFEHSSDSRDRVKTKEMSLNYDKQTKYLTSISPVSRSPKANDYLFENRQKDNNFEPLKLVQTRSPKVPKYKDIEDYEQQSWNRHIFNEKSERILNSIERATSKKLDTEEESNSSRTFKTKSISTKDYEGLALDQLLEVSLAVDKWHKKYPSTTQAKESKEIFNISENYDNQGGADRYGLRLTPIMSEISRDSREGRRSQYQKKRLQNQSSEKKPSVDINPSGLSPRENNPILKKNYSSSSFKIDIDKNSPPAEISLIKSPSSNTETKKMPSKPLLNRLDRKNSRSGTFIRRPGGSELESMVSSPSAIGNKSGHHGMSQFSEYFPDFVVDVKSPCQLVMSGTRLTSHVLYDSNQSVLEKKVPGNIGAGTGKKVESLRDQKKSLQYKRSRNQLPVLGSYTNLDSKSYILPAEKLENNNKSYENQPIMYQKVSNILQEREEIPENNGASRRMSKCWSVKNIPKSVVIENPDPTSEHEVKEVLKTLKKSREGGSRPVKELLIPGRNSQNVVRPGDFLKKVGQQQQQKSFYN